MTAASFANLESRRRPSPHAAFPDLGPVGLPKVLTLYDFDDLYTARERLCGGL